MRKSERKSDETHASPPDPAVPTSLSFPGSPSGNRKDRAGSPSQMEVRRARSDRRATRVHKGSWGWGSLAAFAGLRHLGRACGNPEAADRAAIENAELRLALDADQIIDDQADILLVDGGLVGRAHLVDLGLPFGPGKRRLIEHHAGGMAGEAICVGRVRIRPLGKHAVAGRKIDADGLEREFAFRLRARLRKGDGCYESDR